MQINIHEAKTRLSQLLEQVSQGEEVIIAKAGKPIAKLIPFKVENKPRQPGYWRNKVVIADDFDELPDEIMEYFTGKDK